MNLTTTVALTTLFSLALLSTSLFSQTDTISPLVDAALTPQERIEVEARDPTNPNYCPFCLKKAMHNHFPHACPADLEPLEATTRPEGPRPHEQRCICISFKDLYWMKQDCEQECSFVNDPDAMSHFVSFKDIPGCDKWLDLETGEEKEMDGFEKRNPNHVPEVFHHSASGSHEAEADVAAAEDNVEDDATKARPEDPQPEAEATIDVKAKQVKNAQQEIHAAGEDKAKDEL
ncbi:hypothetical protein EDD11_008704 [Mortierella claussenii]|nr:hypothetical protein EDD11_008704 [Mortierella claussenii]